MKFKDTPFDLAAFGSPLSDILTQVTEEQLASTRLPKGNMLLVDDKQSKAIREKLKDNDWQSAPGGSVLNTIRISAILGLKNYFSGVIGKDPLGVQLRKEVEAANIHADLIESETQTTGVLISLITPDAERTMATYLGAATELSKAHVPNFDKLKQAKIFHATGYKLTEPAMRELIFEAIQFCKDNHIPFSFDPADAWVIRHHEEHILKAMKMADILFLNEDEADAIKTEDGDLFKAYHDTAQLIVLKQGKKGCTVLDCATDVQSIAEGYPAKAIDTTGAGDSFAAGFLYGLIKGYPLHECAAIANFIGSKVVRNMGTILTNEDQEGIKAFMNKLTTPKIGGIDND